MVELRFGEHVSCSDAGCGRLRSLAVNPDRRWVTHLVVEPIYRIGLGRLVPVDLVGPAEGLIGLTCDKSTFKSLPDAEASEPVNSAWTGYLMFPGLALAQARDVHHHLYPGETELASRAQVFATDGAIGRVAGFVTNPEDHGVISVLVSELRVLWGHKTVTVPIGYVDSFHGGVQLNLTASELEKATGTVLGDGA